MAGPCARESANPRAHAVLGTLEVLASYVSAFNNEKMVSQIAGIYLASWLI